MYVTIEKRTKQQQEKSEQQKEIQTVFFLSSQQQQKRANLHRILFCGIKAEQLSLLFGPWIHEKTTNKSIRRYKKKSENPTTGEQIKMNGKYS